MFASPAMVIRLASLVAIDVCVARKFAFKLVITIANKLLHFRGPYLLIRVDPAEWSWQSVTGAQYSVLGTWYDPAFSYATLSLPCHTIPSRFRHFGLSRLPAVPDGIAKTRNGERPKDGRMDIPLFRPRRAPDRPRVDRPDDGLPPADS
jgi:hypothetical protein